MKKRTAENESTVIGPEKMKLFFFDFRTPSALKSMLKFRNILKFSKNAIFAYFVTS